MLGGFQISKSLPNLSQGRACHAGETAISVIADGTARRCHFLPAPIGNIYDDDFEAALLHGEKLPLSYRLQPFEGARYTCAVQGWLSGTAAGEHSIAG